MPDLRFDDTALKMLHRVGGEKLIDKMRGLFRVNAPARLQSIEDALASNDAAAGINPAHSLKSSAGQLGAVRLQNICDRLESACAANDVVSARENLKSAQEELPAAIEWICNWTPIDEKNSSH